MNDLILKNLNALIIFMDHSRSMSLLMFIIHNYKVFIRSKIRSLRQISPINPIGSIRHGLDGQDCMNLSSLLSLNAPLIPLIYQH
jgi:hypothetical protein